MMMSALQAGGMTLLVDGIRTADDNNPRGYFEYERVKKLPAGDTDWLDQAEGKAVKIISALLQYLPEKHSYRVIFMEREMDEILASQERMLARNGKIISDTAMDDGELMASYQRHLKEVQVFLGESTSIKSLTVSYNDILRQPLATFTRVADFLDGQVDPRAMARVVDPDLYREKKA
jgi:hypothetical protein